MAKFTLEKDGGCMEVDAGTGKNLLLDMYQAWNTFQALKNQIAEAVALGDAWVNWLSTKGLPALTHGEAFRLLDAIGEEVVAFQKKFVSARNSKPPDSASDTTSTASSSPPTSS
jgi:hypothetical protein